MSTTSTAKSLNSWRSWPLKDKKTLRDRLRQEKEQRRVIREGGGQPLAGATLPWRAWLEKWFPAVCRYPFAERHEGYWDWLEGLTPGVPPPAFVAVWPRGGAKSTTTELGVVRCGVKLSRRFVLYVSGTQDQANKHVGSIAAFMERAGIERAVSPYGHSKGWNVSLLRTANGFNVAALGLDAASRGVKLDEYRPDLIILDDIDALHDTPQTVAKKIETITDTVLPTGSADCAVAFVQNRIHEDSVMSQVADGTADFLAVREPVSEEPAIRGLTVEAVPQGPGLPNRWKITGGTPTWEGQSLDICQQQIDTFGLGSFRRECQHEVRGATGTFFDVTKINYIDASELPPGLRMCRSGDLAATEGGGDYTALHLLGMSGNYPDVRAYLIDVRRGQWGTEKVYAQIEEVAEEDGPAVTLTLPEDPGQAGKAQRAQLETKFARFRARLKFIRRTGDKATYAQGLQECMNKGNLYVVRAPWNREVVEVWRKFRADGAHVFDDDVDAPADAYNELTETARMKAEEVPVGVNPMHLIAGTRRR